MKHVSFISLCSLLIFLPNCGGGKNCCNTASCGQVCQSGTPDDQNATIMDTVVSDRDPNLTATEKSVMEKPEKPEMEVDLTDEDLTDLDDDDLLEEKESDTEENLD